MRAKRDGLVRNACIALGNTGTAADFPALIGALNDESAIVRGHAAWALGELASRVGELAAHAVPALVEHLGPETDSIARDEIVAAIARISDTSARVTEPGD